jgi:altronate hydrolase
VSRWKEPTFAGFSRADGPVGTRNYWLVVPQVAELARLYQLGQIEGIRNHAPAKNIAQPKRSSIFSSLDGVEFLLHEGGCGATREDSNKVCGLIAGYLHNPNVAGATILSLGCQHAQVSVLREQLKEAGCAVFQAAVHFRAAQKRRGVYDAVGGDQSDVPRAD